MNVRVIGIIVLFWFMFVLAQVFFKWGSGDGHSQLWGFIIGNIFGLTSTWVLMVMYRHMNPSAAFGIGIGGAFLLTQLVLAIVFKTAISPFQWAGIVAIMIGIILLAKGLEDKPMGRMGTHNLRSRERKCVVVPGCLHHHSFAQGRAGLPDPPRP